MMMMPLLLMTMLPSMMIKDGPAELLQR